MWDAIGQHSPVTAAYDRLVQARHARGMSRRSPDPNALRPHVTCDPPPVGSTAVAHDNGWNLADLWETVADQIPDALAQQQGDRTFTWAEFNRRANGIATTLLGSGAVEQDKVAQYLYNAPEYMESIFAAFKAGLAVVNTNYRYAADELVYLWDNADVIAVVFHGTFAEQIEQIRAKVPRIRTWLWVDDGSGPCPDWAVPYEVGRRRGHRRQRAGRLGSQWRPPAAALHRRHHRHAEGRHVAPGRPVRRARRQQQTPHATRAGPRCGARPDHQARPAQHARRTADARHRPVQRDQQPDGRRQRHHDGRPPLQCRGVPRLGAGTRHQLHRRSSAMPSPSRSCVRSTPSRTAGTSPRCG